MTKVPIGMKLLFEIVALEDIVRVRVRVRVRVGVRVRVRVRGNLQDNYKTTIT